MKFCCFRFEMYYTLENRCCYNIRKVKLTSPRLTEHGMMKYYNIPSLRGTKHKRADICFVMTMGYDTFTFDAPTVFISFCPFCGVNLYDYYKSDEYVNEIEGETFKFFKDQ